MLADLLLAAIAEVEAPLRFGGCVAKRRFACAAAAGIVHRLEDIMPRRCSQPLNCPIR